MKKIADWIRPEIVFLAFAPIMGLACLILTPPFQVADEPSHFFRIVQIAEGGIVGERRGAESGGEIPAGLISMAEHFVDGNAASGEVRWDRNKWASVKPYLAQRSDLSERRFLDFRNMTRYAPVVYLPQVVGVWTAKALNLPPLWLVYGGRFCALVFFVGLVLGAIRLTPICPWGFAVLALLPAMIYQAASLSADSTTNALLFFFTALAFRYVFDTPTLTRRDVFALFVLGVSIGLCKSVYVLATGLVFLIPPSKFGGGKKFWMVGVGVTGSAVLSAALWSWAMKSTYVPSFADVDEWAQVSYILHEPLHFISLLLGRFLGSIRFLYLGGGLGLCHEFVGLLGWYAGCIYIGQTSFAALFWCALAEKNDRICIQEWQRWWVVLILSGTVVGVAAVNYITWCAPGWPALALFGRYFHPVAPMAFLLLHNRSFCVQGAEKWKGLILIYFVGVAVATIYVIAKIY